MQALSNEIRLTARLVDSLYVEAMVLADEVRGYFDEEGRIERDLLPPLQRVAFSCESLKVTTRLMHVIAWLLTRRAVDTGEISAAQGRAPGRRLGLAAESDLDTLAMLPEAARVLIDASRDLYARVERLDQEIDQPIAPVPSPALGLLSRLERAF
jgi:regulator of CtrA degradation